MTSSRWAGTQAQRPGSLLPREVQVKELDPARSRRSDKPRLFATLDMAIIQSGVKDVTSDSLYALSSWSMDQGRRFPWYYKREQLILDAHGGRDAVILTVAGAALAKAGPDLQIGDACYQAGVEWRRDIARQWGDTGPGGRDHWQDPVRFGEINHPTDGSDLNDTDDSVNRIRPIEEWITMHAVEVAGPTPEFNPENIEDERLANLWAGLTDKQREVVVLKADGLTTEMAAEQLGISYTAANLRFAAAKAKARGAAA